ncbi:MAG: NAD(P)-dependent oxidoreductase [Phycisphaeraceae bacterium]|nr:NAD(P)-dependent oxidoreductase [Phycisphaeraceae bacterium]
MNTQVPVSEFADISALETNLSEPTSHLVDMFRRLQGDVLIMGAAGKMGPTLARMARRACDLAGTPRRVIGVARFTNPASARALQEHGIETAQGNLLDPDFLDSLPDATLIVYAAGMKFGSTGNEPLTWATNTHLPSLICRRYPKSRIIAFSTGNVYGVVPSSRQSLETDALNPVGEYAMSCLGRERIFQYFSQAHSTPIAILRLNYSTELRYGVIVDLARKVWSGEAVDVTMGYANVIWQTDANAIALSLLEHTSSPAAIFNIAGAEVFRVRDVCRRLGELLDRPANIVGSEAPDALLSQGQKAAQLVGAPRVDLEQIMKWTADWVRRDGATLGLPTHFEVRNGRF